MARIRTIKPEFWTDERVGECSVSARLLLIASLNFADDYGGLERSSKQLKAQAFPYDAIDCEPLVLELVRYGLFIEYEVADRKYLHIKGFNKHQKVENRAKPRIPLYEESLKCHRIPTEDSPSPHREPPDNKLSLREGIKEGNGSRKGSEDPTAHRTAPIATPLEFLDFKLSYPSRSGDQGWRKALRAARARIEEGYSWTEILEGAKRYAAYIRSTGNEGTEYVKQAATFLGPDLFFQQSWDPPKTKAETHRDTNLENSKEWLHAS